MSIEGGKRLREYMANRGGTVDIALPSDVKESDECEKRFAMNSDRHTYLWTVHLGKSKCECPIAMTIRI